VSSQFSTSAGKDSVALGFVGSLVFLFKLERQGGVYQKHFQRYETFKRWNHLTVELFQRQRFFNGRDLWCGSFNKNLSTVRNFNSKDFNGLDLQRQGLLNGRDLGSGSFNGGNLSTVGIFHRLGFGDGRPYFYD